MQNFLENAALLDGLLRRLAYSPEQALFAVHPSRLHHYLVRLVHIVACVVIRVTAVFVKLRLAALQLPAESRPRKGHGGNGHVLRLEVVRHIQRAPVDLVACLDRRGYAKNALAHTR